jgi:hypothetical protein
MMQDLEEIDESFNASSKAILPHLDILRASIDKKLSIFQSTLTLPK